MSSLSTHRQRDRGGGSTGAKALTPNSISNKNPNSALKKSSSGKENPKPFTRSQKPVIKSVPRVEKAAGENGDSRVRWSTSSAPRGRSQSPSEFIRVFSDFKKDKVSRVSVEKKGLRDSSVKRAELGSNQKRALSDFKENKGFGINLEKKSESERKFRGVRGLGSDCGKAVTSSSNSGKSSGTSVNRNFESNNENGGLDFGLKVENCGKVDNLKCDDRIEKIDASVDLRLKESDEKTSNYSKVSETVKEKEPSEGVSTEVGIKYPSKLHEKLTFLEGKVKRIASDIKRTKEMLDMNNPDSTKVILSDIQEKISGIEKAMGNVVGDSRSKIVGSKSGGNNDGGSKTVEKSQDNRVETEEGSVKGLESEELEARLFPHHKLLRNRMPMRPLSKNSQNDEMDVVEPSSDLMVEEKPSSPIEENPIALEFLASLDKDQGKVTTRTGLVDIECDEVLETDEAANSEERGLLGMFSGKGNSELILTSDERLDEFDDQENKQELIIDEEIEDSCIYELNEIGQRTSTGGWFVSEGESVLLAHEDGSCSYYDIANCEVCILSLTPLCCVCPIFH